VTALITLLMPGAGPPPTNIPTVVLSNIICPPTRMLKKSASFVLETRES
jgi:hypothetical protein